MTALGLRFLYIGLFSVGGGLSAVALIQAEIVERLGWLTEETLVDLMAIAEMTPGPIAVNAASFVGMRLRGLPGAALATCACVLPGCLISYMISRASGSLRRSARWRGALLLLRAAVTGVMVCGALTILKNALCPGGGPEPVAVMCFCAGLALYRRWNRSPAAFMLVMGLACGALRMLAAGAAGG